MSEVETAAEAMEVSTETFPEVKGLGNRLLGSVLSWVVVGLFYVTCMLLPLVGAAGKETPHDKANYITFAVVIIIALLVSIAALLSRLTYRKLHGGGLPWIQVVLVAVNAFILLQLFTFRLGI